MNNKASKPVAATKEGEAQTLYGAFDKSQLATAAPNSSVWDAAIRLAESVECLEGFSGHWQNGHAQAKAVIIGLLTAARYSGGNQ